MVFEEFLDAKEIKNNFLFLVLLGIFYVILSFFISKIFFSNNLSISIIFILTMFLVPSTYSMIKKEENMEAKSGLKYFFKNHRFILKVYLALFLGIFVGFILLGNFGTGEQLNYQYNILSSSSDVNSDLEVEVSKENVNLNGAFSIISSNMLVIIIAFVLSLFYGAGALFLIVLNASVFASYVILLLRQFTSYKMYLVSLHMLPELFGFFIAALAGALVSRALYHEKLGSNKFKNVLRDSIMLLLIAFGIIVISAFIEVYFFSSLFI